MRKLALLLAFIVLSSNANAYLISLNEEKYEEEYGENILRIQRDSQVAWARDNLKIIYDYMSRKNTFVYQLSDEQLITILLNPTSKQKSGVELADLSKYEDLVRLKEKGETITELLKRVSIEDLDAPIEEEIEETVEISTDQKRFNCVKKKTLSILDPLWKVNLWINRISDKSLNTILLKTKFLRSC